MRYDMSKFHLEDHQHKSGCPADPIRQDVEVVQLMIKGPRGESIPGNKAVKSRCLDCGRQRIYEPDDAELREITGRIKEDDDGVE